MIIYGILSLLFNNTVTYLIFGGIGLLGIIMHPYLIDFFSKKYLARKHKMITAYKNS